jgi:hypothetical protein
LGKRLLTETGKRDRLRAGNGVWEVCPMPSGPRWRYLIRTTSALTLATAAEPATAAWVHGEVQGYLQPRLDQLRHAAFWALGLPIGCGASVPGSP